MIKEWLIRVCLVIILALIIFITGYQLNLAKRPQQKVTPEPTEQPESAESNPILYTTLLEDFSRTIVTLDPVELSITRLFPNRDLGSISNPVWSRSHKNILYAIQVDENVYSFGITDAKGNNPRQLTKPLPFEALVNGAWSFDDKYIASIISPNRYALSTHAVVVINVEEDQGEVHQLMSDGVWTYAWSPIDNRLAVIKWKDSAESGLHIIGIDGIQQDFFPASKFFPREVPTLISIAWSSDGQEIVVTNFPDEVNPVTNELTQVKEIYVINLNTHTIDLLTNQQANLIERSISCLNWSPNGRTLSFVSDYKTINGQTRQGALIVVDIEDKVETQLAHYVVTWACPVWSLDGEKIAFISIDNPQNVNGDIYVAEVVTNTVRRLTNDKQAKNDLSW